MALGEGLYLGRLFHRDSQETRTIGSISPPGEKGIGIA